MSQEKNEKLGFSKKSSGVVLKDVTKIFQQPDTGKDFVAQEFRKRCRQCINTAKPETLLLIRHMRNTCIF